MSVTLLYYAAGAAIGMLTLAFFWRAPVGALAENGYVALACMLMIYVGAHLVASDLDRIIFETAFALLVLGGAMVLRSRWPVGVGVLVLGHALYDFVLGHDAGVADWYPPMCVGYDLVVGAGFVFLMSRRRSGAS
ncbi:MAG: hypothetical protein AAGJ87_03015 [Pseudomonadota bacterium]